MVSSEVLHPERWARVWSGRRVGPIPLTSLLAWQIAVLAVLAAAVAAPAMVLPASLVLGLVAFGTLTRVHGRPVYRRIPIAARHSDRRRSSRNPAPAQGFPLADHDALVPLLYLRPDLSVTTVTGRSGGPVGVISDGTGFTAIIAADEEALVPSMRPTSVGVGTLADLCDPDGVGVDSVQLLVRVAPAPAAAAASTVPGLAASYAAVNVGGTAAAVSWSVAVRLTGSGSGPGSVDGGAGSKAVLAEVRSRADRCTKSLTAAGLPCRLLDDSQVLAGLAASVDADRRRPRSALARVIESPDAVEIDGLTHVTVWIRSTGGGSSSGGPVDTGALVRALSGAATSAATVSVIVGVAEGRRLRMSTFVRLTATSSGAADAAVRHLGSRLAEYGLDAVLLTAEQLPGLLATVPLGGGRT